MAGISETTYTSGKVETYGSLENEPLLRAHTGEPDLGGCANIVVRHTRNVSSNCNYKLYFVNYYTTLPLLFELEKSRTTLLAHFGEIDFLDWNYLMKKKWIKSHVLASIFVGEYRKITLKWSEIEKIKIKK